MRTSLTRFLAAVLTALVALLVLVGPIGSATAADDTGTEQDPTAGTSRLRFGIGPAREVPDDQYVDGRAYLTYAVNPGAVLSDQIALLNYSKNPLRLKVYATDATQDASGAFGLLAGDETPRDAGSWITMDLPKNGKVVVPPRTKKAPGRALVPFQAAIPAKATPGDHVGGVLASLKVTSTNKDGAKIKLDQRIGIRAYFRVSGPLTPALKIEKLKATYTDVSDPLGRGTIDVSYVVHNTGNIRLDASQNVTVSRWLADDLVVQPAVLSDILPGSRISVRQTFKHAFGFGNLRARVDVFPRSVDPSYTSAIDPVTKEVSFQAWPWLLLVIIGGVILILILGPLFWRWRRHRAKKRRLALVEPDDDGDVRGRGRSARPLAGVTGATGGAGSHARRVQGLAASVVAVLTMLGPSAQAEPTDSSPVEVLLEGGDVTGNPAHGIAVGWWGHEGGKRKGPSGTGTTFISADASDRTGAVTDASIAALHKALGDGGSFDSLRVAFVPASADGSAERPRVTQGQNAGEVFPWFADLGFGAALGGTDTTADSVATVSTLDEYTAWWKAGRPLQGYTRSLEVVDIADDGATVKAATPQGRSLLNRWPAGSKISMVLYVSDGVDEDYPLIPTVAVGDDGRAKAAWLTFTTVADPTEKSHTSAGYRVLSYSRQTLRAIATGGKSTPGGSQGGGGGTGKGQHGGGKDGAKGDASDGAAGATSAGDRGSENWLLSSLPGGSMTFLVLLGAVAVGLIAVVTLRLRRGR